MPRQNLLSYSYRYLCVLFAAAKNAEIRGVHLREIYGQCTKFARVIKISQVLVFHFTTPFSGSLQGRI